MKMSTFCIFLLACLLLVTSQSIRANTISDYYKIAFINPHGFDNVWLEGFLISDLDGNNLYDQFELCATPTLRLITKMEKELRQNHYNCNNNSSCAEIAEDITFINELKTNVQDLSDFLQLDRIDDRHSFLNSKIGKATLIIYNYNKENNMDVRNNQAYIKGIGILSRIPCQ
jgi:hypothetical protein